MFDPKPRHAKINFALFVTLLASLTSCGNQQEVSFKSGGMTQTFAQGKAAIPKEFDKLVYPEAATTGSVSADGDNEEQSKFLMLTSKDSAETVSKWYQDQLKSAEWKVDKVENPSPNQVSIYGHKADLDMNVMISEEGQKESGAKDEGQKTVISLSIGKLPDGAMDTKEPTENYTPDKVTPPTD
jgi:hypothetical protein